MDCAVALMSQVSERAQFIALRKVALSFLGEATEYWDEALDKQEQLKYEQANDWFEKSERHLLMADSHARVAELFRDKD